MGSRHLPNRFPVAGCGRRMPGNLLDAKAFSSNYNKETSNENTFCALCFVFEYGCGRNNIP
ncbi:hypothetical protein LT85_3762 [Collimonas arenae]|uniref:Uncharacterized protein n=1 Tax=Collimonas arenae TaxID=279058 RepID=A0A0A1FGS1_9BURK|nr:hypothetical protein LT85_3762 [Collimonas arenae]